MHYDKRKDPKEMQNDHRETVNDRKETIYDDKKMQNNHKWKENHYKETQYNQKDVRGAFYTFVHARCISFHKCLPFFSFPPKLSSFR